MIQTQYATVRYPMPVLNTPDFKTCFGGKTGEDLPLDEQNLMRTVETVLFPGTQVELVERVAESHIWQIKTCEYSYSGKFYIDERFVEKEGETFRQRKIEVPPIPQVIERLSGLIGTPYIWGGNWPEGIDYLLKLYPPKREFSTLSPLIQNTWRLKGVDCSGLLYYATNGFTPRNTSDLLTFGRAVDIENKDANALCEKLEDLDIIVWKGHIICVFDKETVVESAPPNKLLPRGGVSKFNLLKRVQYIMKERIPVNIAGSTEKPHFVVRRWHHDNK